MRNAIVLSIALAALTTACNGEAGSVSDAVMAAADAAQPEARMRAVDTGQEPHLIMPDGAPTHVMDADLADDHQLSIDRQEPAYDDRIIGMIDCGSGVTHALAMEDGRPHHPTVRLEVAVDMPYVELDVVYLPATGERLVDIMVDAGPRDAARVQREQQYGDSVNAEAEMVLTMDAIRLEGAPSACRLEIRAGE